MIYIKRFVDKLSYMDSKQNKDVILPIIEARGLRDELIKLLADLNELKTNNKSDDTKIEVKLIGGKF